MNIITDFLEDSVKKYPDKIALVTSGKEYTYNELHELVRSFSSSLIQYPKNSVISLLFENSVEFVISYLGTLLAGCIAHLIPPSISDSNFIDQIKSAQPKIIITSNEFLKKIERMDFSGVEKLEISKMLSGRKSYVERKPSPEDIAYLIYTSGTTSNPKGVPITHSNSVFTTHNIMNVLNYSESDIHVLPLPLFHSFGLGCLHTSLGTGSTLVLHQNMTDVPKVLSLMKIYKATTFAAVPATLKKILYDSSDKLVQYFSELRLILTNSTSISPDTVKGFKKILKNGKLATYYGLTEASRSTFMIFDDNGERYTSVGLPAPGVQIKIVNEKGEIGDKGVIWIRGNNVIKKYWNNPQADKNIIEGWLRTGDIGYIDHQGYLYLTGRIDDVINIGGEKVMPEEVERVVNLLPGIEEAVAIGIRHEIFGQVVKLFVRKSDESTIEKSDILSHCMKNLERYKIPVAIEFVNEFPRTEYGKVKRFMLQ